MLCVQLNLSRGRLETKQQRFWTTTRPRLDQAENRIEQVIVVEGLARNLSLLPLRCSVQWSSHRYHANAPVLHTISLIKQRMFDLSFAARKVPRDRQTRRLTDSAVPHRSGR